MGVAVRRPTHHLGYVLALLWFGLLGWRRHGLPCAIAKPVTVHILCGVDVKKSPGNARILQHIFRSRLQRQWLRLRQVEASRLILFAIEDRDRDDATGLRLPHLAGPL